MSLRVAVSSDLLALYLQLMPLLVAVSSDLLALYLQFMPLLVALLALYLHDATNNSSPSLLPLQQLVAVSDRLASIYIKQRTTHPPACCRDSTEQYILVH